MVLYSHRQEGRFFKIIFAVTGVVGALVVVLSGPDIGLYRLLLIAVILAAGLVLANQFTSLSTEVSDTDLRWWFGWGLWRKSVPLGDIATAEPVTNKWWWGWGIRYYGKGWLYNVSGLDAVEIVLHSGKHIRIGTDDPQGLATAIGRLPA